MKSILLITIALLLSLSASAQGFIGPANAHLQGRTVLGTLPKPSYSAQAEGRVVVQIKVNQYGEVTDAIPGIEGTTVTDKNLWTAARNAALKAHFNQKADAPAAQLGTITYIFRKDSDNNYISDNSGGQDAVTPIKELLEAPVYDTYLIKAQFVKTYDLNKLIFSVGEDDYIIPIQLQKKDLGAVNRFMALNVQAGDTLTIKGTLSKIYLDLEDYFSLVNAVIMDIRRSNDSTNIQ